MGVKGLWQLLLPTGRRISIETLAGKTLAIDASIWLVQFIKVNRDPETGKVNSAAHIIGFFRRICKLLYHNIRPVFVFDGDTPEIKLREIRARRERREKLHSFASSNDSEGVKRLARRILVSNLKKQKQLEVKENKKKIEEKNSESESNGAFATGFQLASDDNQIDSTQQDNLSESNKLINLVKDENGVDSIQNILSETKQFLDNASEENKQNLVQNDWDDAVKYDEENLADNENSDSNESVQLPCDENDLDIDVLSALPSKTRLDVIQKAKRQQRMQSRKEFMQVAADPDSYSQCQLRNFIKSANLNNKIDKVGKIVSKVGEDGIEGEAIASDRTRRFVFTKDGDDVLKHNNNMIKEKLVKESIYHQEKQGNASTQQKRKRLRKSHDESSDSGDDNLFSTENAVKDKASIYLNNFDDDGDHDAIEGGFINASNRDIIKKAIPEFSSDDDSRGGGFIGGSNVKECAIELDNDDDDDSGGGGFIRASNKDCAKNNKSEKGSMVNKRIELSYDDDDDYDDASEGGFVKASNKECTFEAKCNLSKDPIRNIHIELSSDDEDDDASGGGFIRGSNNSIGDKEAAIELSSDDSYGKGVISAPDDNFAKDAECDISIIPNTNKHIEHYCDDDDDSNDASGGGDQQIELNTGDEVIVMRDECIYTKCTTTLDDIPNDEDDTDNDEIEWEDCEPGNGQLNITETFPLQKNEDNKCIFNPGDDNDGVFTTNDTFNNARSDISKDLTTKEQIESNCGASRKGNKGGTAINHNVSSGIKRKIDELIIDKSTNTRFVPASDDALNDELGWEDCDSKNHDVSNPKTQMTLVSLKSRMSSRSGEENRCESIDKKLNYAEDEFSGPLVKEVDLTMQPNKNQKCEKNDPIDEDFYEEIVWEEGDETMYATGEATTSIAKQNTMCHEENNRHESDFVVASRSENANTLALKKAHATAAHLTDWAGRAVKRAITAHLNDNESGTPKGNFSEDDDTINSSTTSIDERANETAHPASLSSQYTSLDALREEEKSMQEVANRRERDIETVTDDMIDDVIHLLQLFGIPYLKARTEAEAQCVALEKMGLVDGVVTEDSDALVFGSKCVYKNIFDDKKYVEVYLAKDAEKLGIGFNEKIALAMLLGGDYTVGVNGVGIVNGMEILQAFPVKDGVQEGLSAFRKWLDGCDNLIDNGDGSNAKSTLSDTARRFHNDHKSARLRWVTPKDFPSRKVFQAYSNPVVDTSKTQFTYGIPDSDNIRMFCLRKMGWNGAEVDRALLPVLGKINNSGPRQTRLDGYFMRYEDDHVISHQIRSKRLKKVLSSVTK